MSEKIDIDELECMSSSGKSVRDRIERIVAAYGKHCNKGCKYPASYGYNGHEIVDGIIEITMEFYCQGTTDLESLHAPARLVNATGDELDAWFEKRAEQIKLRDEIDKKRESIEAADSSEKDLLAAFGNLNDHDWVHARIVEVSGLINENHANRSAIDAEMLALKGKLAPEFDVASSDGSVFDALHDKENRKGTRLFSEGSWRDICK